MTSEITIRPMADADAEAVLAIYQAGIDTGNATFETTAPDWATFTAGKLPGHRLVATDPDSGAVLGWAALSPVSDRCAYAGVAENAVYVDPRARRRGVGQALLRELVTRAEQAGIWTVQTGVFPENTASRAVHEKVGFRVVDSASGSAAITGSGGTCCSWSAAARSCSNYRCDYGVISATGRATGNGPPTSSSSSLSATSS